MDVSVIIPCRNEAAHIETTLQRILDQQGIGTEFTLEVLFVEGYSDDETYSVLSKMASSYNFVKVLRNKDQTTPFAFNLGIKNSTGKYVCILGAHAEIAPDYISQCLRTVELHDAGNVGGPWRAEGKSRTGKLIAKVFNDPLVVGNARSHDLGYEGYVDSVWGGFYKREVFDQVGLFDEELVRNQDDEFNLRVNKAGFKIWQTPDIKYKYYVRDSIKNLFLQYYQYGFWKVRVIQKHKSIASYRHIVPTVFVLSLLVSLVGSIASATFATLFTAIVLSYCLFVLTVIFRLLGRKVSLKDFLTMFGVIGAYHFGYGFGFLKGIVHFCLLKNNGGQNQIESRITR